MVERKMEATGEEAVGHGGGGWVEGGFRPLRHPDKVTGFLALTTGLIALGVVLQTFAPKDDTYRVVRFGVSGPGEGRLGTSLAAGAEGVVYGTSVDGGKTGQGTVFALNHDGSEYRVMHSFGTGDGAGPAAGVVIGEDGSLYGTTVAGGGSGHGAVFKLNPDGSGYRLLHSFTGEAADGVGPCSKLAPGGERLLYGTTLGGGASACGTIYRISSDGSEYAVLHHFTKSDAEGYRPYSGVVAIPQGNLFGTTLLGGSHDSGTVFRLDADGGVAVLHNFGETAGDGRNAVGTLLCMPGGVLYGTTLNGGRWGVGTIFRLKADGTGYRVVHDFSWSRGVLPWAGLIAAQDGALYGTTPGGGSGGCGTLFSFDPRRDHHHILHSFGAGSKDGEHPLAALVLTSEGSLVGTTSSSADCGPGTIFRLDPPGRAKR